MNPMDWFVYSGGIYLIRDGKAQRLNKPEKIDEVIANLKNIRDQKKEEKSVREQMETHLAAILHELAHAKVRYPDDESPWDTWDFVHMCSVMMEEAGEAVREANKTEEVGDDAPHCLALYNELAQTAAMCIRIMEEIKNYSQSKCPSK